MRYVYGWTSNQVIHLNLSPNDPLFFNETEFHSVNYLAFFEKQEDYVWQNCIENHYGNDLLAEFIL